MTDLAILVTPMGWELEKPPPPDTTLRASHVASATLKCSEEGSSAETQGRTEVCFRGERARSTICQYLLCTDLSARSEMTPYPGSLLGFPCCSTGSYCDTLSCTDCINFHGRIHTDCQGQHRELQETQQFTGMPVISSVDLPKWTQPVVAVLITKGECQCGCKQTVYFTPLHITPDKLLMIGRLQELPIPHLTPQATSWALNEITEKRQTLRGRVVFLLHTNDSTVVIPLWGSTSTVTPILKGVISANGP